MVDVHTLEPNAFSSFTSSFVVVLGFSLTFQTKVRLFRKHWNSIFPGENPLWALGFPTQHLVS